jgi:superfamily II RNA helicase
MGSNVDLVLEYLESKGFIKKSETISELTDLGKIAVHIRETHCLVLSTLVHEGLIGSEIPVEDLVGFFSCFTAANVPEDYKCLNLNSCEDLETRPGLKELITHTSQLYDKYQTDEINLQIKSGIDYTIHYDLIGFAIEWAGVSDVVQAKELLGRLELNKKIFLGEFVKAILKIVNIANELYKVANSFGFVGLAHKLEQIPALMLKFVATNQSLYV